HLTQTRSTICRRRQLLRSADSGQREQLIHNGMLRIHPSGKRPTEIDLRTAITHEIQRFIERVHADLDAALNRIEIRTFNFYVQTLLARRTQILQLFEVPVETWT